MATVTTLAGISECDYSLNPALYVEQLTDEEKLSVQEAIAKTRRSSEECEKARLQLKELLNTNGVIA
jgi:type I restriction-modification system DNA methylase subunit